MPRQTSRREFLQTTAATGLGFWVSGLSHAQGNSPNEKLNIALIGCGGKGTANLAGVASENIVALCDVDGERARGAFEKYANAPKYTDYRIMLDKHPEIEAVVVTTPDHTHACISTRAMRMGKHVYCEKPLTRTIAEARRMRQVASECKVATQMGNQGHSNNGARKAVDVVRSGALGPVREVHAWTDRPGHFWSQPMQIPTQSETAPSTLDWDLWLGPAQMRAYHSVYAPFSWRGWWDFGTGALGDMACHVADMAFWALDLNAPTRISAEHADLDPRSPPAWSVITYQFPARGERPPVKFVWYDGGKRPSAELVGSKELAENGSILIGDEGTLYSPDPYGSYFILGPREKFADYKYPEPQLPRSPGHYVEWIRACKGGPAALSNFDYAAQLTETVLLGNLALRTGEVIEWDAAQMRSTNSPKANDFVQAEYRKGFELS